MTARLAAPRRASADINARIVELWNAGLSGTKVAEAIGVNEAVVWGRLVRLQVEGLAMRHEDRPNGANRRRAERAERVKRRCLRCVKPFASIHAGNRICPRCLEYAGENGSAFA